MILYLDTSALLKKYFKEDGSTDVISLWKDSTAIVSSSVTYAETIASIDRKKGETTDIDDEIFRAVLKSFQKDWKSFVRVDVNDDLNKRIYELTDIYPLGGFAAIHLASALVVFERIAENFIFACYDKRLSEAAKQKGLNTYPPFSCEG